MSTEPNIEEPNPLGTEPYQTLRAEIWTLKDQYEIWRGLFGSQERVDLVNRAGSMLFEKLQFTLANSNLLAISRLTDPRTTGRRFTNVSLAMMFEQIPRETALFPTMGPWNECIPEGIDSLGALHDEVLTRSEDIREFRNRVLAHNDDNEHRAALAAHIFEMHNDVGDIIELIETFYLNCSMQIGRSWVGFEGDEGRIAADQFMANIERWSQRDE